jgi:MoxR-like ATPase
VTLSFDAAAYAEEDVQAVAAGVLGHRLIVRPKAEVEGKHALDVVHELLDTVPVLETGLRKPRRG